MRSLQINRYYTTDLSPKDALRAHVEQLSPEQQREFIAAALQLIVARPTLENVDIAANYQRPSRGKTQNIAH